MQHMRRHVIILTAWVLVLVTVLATPASAALTGKQILISDLEVNSVTSGLQTVTEYSYPGSFGSSSTYWSKSSVNSTVFSGSHGSLTLSSSRSVNFYISPAYYHTVVGKGTSYASSDDLFYFNDLLLFNDFTSCILTASLTLQASVEISGTVWTYVIFLDSSQLESGWSYAEKASSSQRFDFTLSAGEYTPFDFEIDILDKMSTSGADCFIVYHEVYFKNVPSGATLSWSASAPPGSYDDLSPGFRVITTTSKSVDPPTITKQPKAYSAFTTNSDSFTLSVEASFPEGGLPAFQWYKGSSVVTMQPIVGAISATYTETITGPSDNYYYCVVSNVQSGMSKSVQSNSAHVVVVEPPETPQITQNLADGATLEYVQGVTPGPLSIYAITTDGGTLSYQWYNFVQGEPENILSGYTSSTFTPSTDEIGTLYYYCVVTNTKAGFKATARSGVVAIRVVSAPDPALTPVITVDLNDEYSFKEGKTGVLSISAASPDGGVLSYQWYRYTDDNPSRILIPGDSPTLILDTSEPGKFYYYCVVKNNLNGTSAFVSSNTASVIIEADDTSSFLGDIISGITEMIDGVLGIPGQIVEGIKGLIAPITDGVKNIFDSILGLPGLIIDGIKGLFVPDEDTLASYQDRWFSLLASRFGAIYQAVMLIDEFGQAISDQAATGVVDFPQVTINLAGTPFVFGGWQVDVVPDGFDMIFDALKLMIDIVATLAFLNGLRHRFEGILGGE